MPHSGEKEIKMKRNTVKGIVAGALAGALAVSAVPAIASGINAVLNSVNISINGVKVASDNENYVLQNGTEVPYSILYEGTTYLPIRKISELLDSGIDWDNDTRTVLIETSNSGRYDDWGGVPDFGEFYGIEELSVITNTRSTTHWYTSKDVSNATKYVEELTKRGYKRVEEGEVKSKFQVYQKGSTEVWLDLGLYTNFVYGVTIVDTSRPITGRHYILSGVNEDIPDFCSAFGYVSSGDNKKQYVDGDFHLWSCLPDYFALLEENGFEISNIGQGSYGKTVTFKKDRSSIGISFTGSQYSTIPTLTFS